MAKSGNIMVGGFLYVFQNLYVSSVQIQTETSEKINKNEKIHSRDKALAPPRMVALLNSWVIF